jgi:hypothetical protein
LSNFTGNPDPDANSCDIVFDEAKGVVATVGWKQENDPY